MLYSYRILLITIMNITSLRHTKQKARHKRTHTFWINLYHVQEQIKLIYSNRNHISGYLWWMGILTGNERSFWGERTILYFEFGDNIKCKAFVKIHWTNSKDLYLDRRLYNLIGYRGKYIFFNSLKCMLKICGFLSHVKLYQM